MVRLRQLVLEVKDASTEAMSVACEARDIARSLKVSTELHLDMLQARLTEKLELRTFVRWVNERFGERTEDLMGRFNQQQAPVAQPPTYDLRPPTYDLRPPPAPAAFYTAAAPPPAPAAFYAPAPSAPALVEAAAPPPPDSGALRDSLADISMKVDSLLRQRARDQETVARLSAPLEARGPGPTRKASPTRFRPAPHGSRDTSPPRTGAMSLSTVDDADSEGSTVGARPAPARSFAELSPGNGLVGEDLVASRLELSTSRRSAGRDEARRELMRALADVRNLTGSLAM
eukprot:tig00001408_g8606.t1